MYTNRSAHLGISVLGIMLRLAVLMIPLTLLLIAAARFPGGNNTMLWLAVGFQAVVCTLTLLSRSSWAQPMGPSIITLYLIGLCWLWFGDGVDDWYTHLSKAILLIVPLIVFGTQTLSDSGALAIRRARLLADSLAQRRDWPADPVAVRTLPEVKALRAALTVDVAPALALLDHPRLEVRVAALAALEFRKDW